MFQRVLGQWACDVLALQRKQQHDPTWRPGYPVADDLGADAGHDDEQRLAA